mgnify:CR=1 FL=1
MNPQDQRSNPAPYVPARETSVFDRDDRASHQAAANIARSQIDAIYQNGSAAQKTQSANNPYQRTHDQLAHDTTQTAWQKYHSAWQNYYQQYYERYYVSQVHQAKIDLEKNAVAVPADRPLTKDEAIDDLRSELRKNVETHAKKVKSSRHFWPAMAGLSVMLIFLFLQYNRVLFANVEAYISPGNIDPQNLIVDPSTTTAVGPDPKIIIPKINVNIPIVWTAVASDQNSLNKAMNDGAAWFNIPGANARPGQVGNSVFSAHSSNDWLDQSDYKFAFARLEQMKEGDTVYINYNSKRYVYTVTHTKVVLPTQVDALVFPTDKPVMTLITCVPLGTADKRLLVFADQVSPDPTGAEKAAPEQATSEPAVMPRNSPTFLERLFGAN